MAWIDVLAVAVGLVTFAGLVGGYSAVSRAVNAAAERERARELEAMRRQARSSARSFAAIGGVNRPGEN